MILPIKTNSQKKNANISEISGRFVSMVMFYRGHSDPSLSLEFTTCWV